MSDQKPWEMDWGSSQTPQQGSSDAKPWEMDWGSSTPTSSANPEQQGTIDKLKGEITQNPSAALESAASSAGETYGSLLGGKTIANALVDEGAKDAIAKGVANFLPGKYGKIASAIAPSLVHMAAFAGGSKLAHEGIKGAENQLGAGESIDEAQKAAPTVANVAGTAAMAPMAISSAKGYIGMGLKKAIPAAIGAAGGGAVYPYIDYGVRKGMGDQNAALPTGQDVLHSARDMAVFGGEGFKKAAKDNSVTQTKEGNQEQPTEPEEPAVPLDEQEKAAAEEAHAKVTQAEDVAVQSAEDAGLSETAAALRQTSKKSRVDDTATKVDTTPALPVIRDSAHDEADRLGIDIADVPPNKYNQITAADVRKYAIANPPPTNEEIKSPETSPATPEIIAQQPETPAAESAGVLPEVQPTQVAEVPKPKRSRKKKAADSYFDESTGQQMVWDETQDNGNGDWVPEEKVGQETARTPVAETPQPEIPDAGMQGDKTEEQPPLESSVDEQIPQGASAVTEPPVASPTEEPVVEEPKEPVTPLPAPRSKSVKNNPLRAVAEKEFLTWLPTSDLGHLSEEPELAQSIYRAKDEDQFVKWATSNYPDLTEASARQLYQDVRTDFSRNQDTKKFQEETTAQPAADVSQEINQPAVAPVAEGVKRNQFTKLEPDEVTGQTHDAAQSVAQGGVTDYTQLFPESELQDEYGKLNEEQLQQMSPMLVKAYEAIQRILPNWANKFKDDVKTQAAERGAYTMMVRQMGKLVRGEEATGFSAGYFGIGKKAQKGIFSDVVKQVTAKGYELKSLEKNMEAYRKIVPQDKLAEYDSAIAEAQANLNSTETRTDAKGKVLGVELRGKEYRPADANKYKGAMLERFADELSQKLRRPEDRTLVDPRDSGYEAFANRFLKAAADEVRKTTLNRRAAGLETVNGDLGYENRSGDDTTDAQRLTEGGGHELLQTGNVTNENEFQQFMRDASTWNKGGQSYDLRTDGVYSPEQQAQAVAFVDDKSKDIITRMAVAERLILNGELTADQADRFTKLVSDAKKSNPKNPEIISYKRARGEQFHGVADMISKVFKSNQGINELIDRDDQSGDLTDFKYERRRYMKAAPSETEFIPSDAEQMGEMAGHDLVKQVFKTSKNPIEKAIAKILLKNGSLKDIKVKLFNKLDEGTVGFYDDLEHAIYLTTKDGKGFSNSVALHEVFHSLTRAFLLPENRDFLSEQQLKAVDGIQEVFEKARQEAVRMGVTSEEKYGAFENAGDRQFSKDELQHYGWSSVDEFVTHAMTDKRFQDVLRSIKLRDQVKGENNAFQRFIDQIKKLFGIKNDGSALSHAVDHIMTLAMDKTVNGDKGQDFREINALGYQLQGNRVQARVESRSKYSDEDNPLMVDTKSVNQSSKEAQDFLTPFRSDYRGALDALKQWNAPISQQAKQFAAATLEGTFRKIAKELDDQQKAGKAIDITQLTAANKAADQAYRLGGRIGTLGAQILALRKNLDVFSGTKYVDNFLKATLGGTIDDLTSGKVNTDVLKDGIENIKQEIADTAVSNADKLLQVFGVTDPAAIDRLKSHMGDLNSSPKNLKNLVRELMGGDKANPDKVTALTQQLTSLYNAAHNRIAKDRASKLADTAFSGMIDRNQKAAFADKLAGLMASGRYDEDMLDQAVLSSLGIKGYDASTIKKMRNMVNRIQELPEDSDMQNKLKTQFKSALATEILSKKWDDSGLGRKIWMGLTEIGPELFRSLILTGPQTFMTHGFSGALNTRLSGAALAYGYYHKAIAEGVDRHEAMGYFRDFLDTMMVPNANGARSGVHLKQAKSAIYTGEMGIAAEQGIGKRGADALADSDFLGQGTFGKGFRTYAGLASFGGRAMMAFDAVNAGTARELALRLASRAALLEGGLKGEAMDERVRQIFAPTQEEMSDAKAKLKQEVDKGFFKGMTDKQAMFSKAARLDQLFLQDKLPEDVIGKAEEDAMKFSKDSTLKGDLTGSVGMLASSIGEMSQRFPLIKYMFPFIRIIGTLMNTSLEYTPIGFLRANNASLSNAMFGSDSRYARYAHQTYEKGSPEQIALMAKSVLGTTSAMFITTAFLSQLDDEIRTGKKPAWTIYGAGPKDSAKRSELMASGWRPETICIGNTYLPYKAIPGINLLLTALGTLHDELVYDNPPPKLHGKLASAHAVDLNAERMMGIALAVVRSPLQHHFLDGAKNMVDILYGGEGAAGARAVRAAESAVLSPASQFTNPSILRTTRKLVEGLTSPNGQAANLSQSTFQEKLASFTPFYMGYNKPSLNVLGEPITQNALDAVTDRWIYSLNSAPNPILSPLAQNGIFIPGPKKSTPIYVDRKGTAMTLHDAGDDAWRTFQIERGKFLKQILTPQLVHRLTQMNRDEAQAYVSGPSIAYAANHAATLAVEEMVLSGKLKVNKS